MQSYPVGNKPNGVTHARAEHLKRVCAEAAGNGALTWNDIFSEEVAEFWDEADEDYASQREEAIQVAAVIVAMIEDGDIRYGHKVGASLKRRKAAQEEADSCRD